MRRKKKSNVRSGVMGRGLLGTHLILGQAVGGFVGGACVVVNLSVGSVRACGGGVS